MFSFSRRVRNWKLPQMVVFNGHLYSEIACFTRQSLENWSTDPRKFLFANLCTTTKPETSRFEKWEEYSAIKKITTQGQECLPYPRTNLMISPGWRISPTSSQTDTVIEPVLSATRHARTTWASFVLVAFPTRNSREFSFSSNRERVTGQGRLTDFQNYE